VTFFRRWTFPRHARNFALFFPLLIRYFDKSKVRDRFELCLMKNAFQYSHRAFGFSILTAEEAAVDCHGRPLMSYSAVPHYLKIT